MGATVGLSCGLKSLSRLVGLPVVEVDRARIHELTGAQRGTACEGECQQNR